MVQNIHRLPAVKRFTGRGKTGVYELVKEGKLRRPLKIGKKAVGWTDDDVAEYQRTLIAERDAATAA